MSEDLIYQLALKTRILRTMRQEAGLSEREQLILVLLSLKGEMSIAEIINFFPNISTSTISNTLNKLWKEDKLILKTIDPETQKRLISFTKEGLARFEEEEKNRKELYKVLNDGLNLSEAEKKVWERILKRANDLLADLIEAKR